MNEMRWTKKIDTAGIPCNLHIFSVKKKKKKEKHGRKCLTIDEDIFIIDYK